MKLNIARILSALAMLLALTAPAQLPPDFPTLTVTTNYPPAVGDGLIFMGINLPAAGAGYYAMIVTNDGTPVWFESLTNACWDFKVLPNGLLHYAQQTRALTYTGGGDVLHQILDDNFYVAESIAAGNGYVAEAHDFKMLPNGNVLLIGYYLTKVDMSQVVTNGNPGALVSGAVIQELDGQRNVVWQWRSWDHYPFTSQWVNSTAAVISEFHINCIFLDTDGNLVVSTPDWVKKINRQTGDIMWHLGGVENQFTFVGVSQEQGVRDFASHDINRLPNGDVLLYNNSRFGQPGSTSTVHEFALDETNKVATLIWNFVPQPGIAGPFQGSAERLSNGNTFIGWGGLGGLTSVACMEVAGSNVVFQMKFDNTNIVSYRAVRFPYPTYLQKTAVAKTELAQGNSYTFDPTGVTIDVQTGAGGYNQLTVTRQPFAPRYPLFQGKAPRLLPIRISLSGNSIASLGGTIDFDPASLGLTDPTNLTVYYRPTTDQGLFAAQPTSYDSGTGRLTVQVSLTSQVNDLGEFALGSPDVADIAFPPMLNQVVNYQDFQGSDVIAPKLSSAGENDGVNEQQPILISWSPKGFARSYQFQISTNQDFSTTVVSVSYQTDAFYVWRGATAGSTYYYRSKTVNEGGTTDWATGSFTTVAPFVGVTYPKGGEALRRGAPHFIQWKDNLGQPVTIQLYKSGVLVQTISTNAPNLGAYSWNPGQNIVPGSDYSIQVSSLDGSISSSSAAAFSVVDAPSITAGSAIRLANGSVQFQLLAPGAAQVSVYGSTNLSNWQLIQVVPVSNGTATFVDTTKPNLNPLFYRLGAP